MPNVVLTSVVVKNFIRVREGAYDELIHNHPHRKNIGLDGINPTVGFRSNILIRPHNITRNGLLPLPTLPMTTFLNSVEIDDLRDGGKLGWF